MIPPLRKRGNDVIEIFEKIAVDRDEVLALSDEVKKYFVEYSWEGNVREVRNCVEYLINLDKETVYIEDLPESMRLASLLDGQEMGLIDVFEPLEINPINEDVDEDAEILKLLFDKNSRNIKIGRKQLSDELRKIGIFLGEQEVRNRLLVLQEKGLVLIGKGRGGTKITAIGIKRLKRNK
jgi:DNA-binding NtrC family response regulator